mmetsp:Transcript_47278/g.75767  ORF Transcript_47278/g.75767 Transcript_47278/m.75767 type:complete len:106 (+) Transcript_47278:34-351(+)
MNTSNKLEVTNEPRKQARHLLEENEDSTEEEDVERYVVVEKPENEAQDSQYNENCDNDSEASAKSILHDGPEERTQAEKVKFDKQFRNAILIVAAVMSFCVFYKH